MPLLHPGLGADWGLTVRHLSCATRAAKGYGGGATAELTQPSDQSAAAVRTSSPWAVPGVSPRRIAVGPYLGEEGRGQRRLAFVYGTLKKGFSNFWLMQKLEQEGHAWYLGTARSKHKFPLVCGPFQVPFMLYKPGRGHHVKGEVYAVDEEGVCALDVLEGTEKGHYRRIPLLLKDLEVEATSLGGPGEDILGLLHGGPNVLSEAYFAHGAFSDRMLPARHIDSYTEEEFATYVPRKQRPPDRTFLEHVHCWLEENGEVTCELEQYNGAESCDIVG